MNEITKGMLMTPFNILYKISPHIELKLLYWLKTGRVLHLENPVSFNEKMQWLKLFDTKRANELKIMLSDKYLAREYVASQSCGGDILNTIYWHGYKPEEIPFDKLPNRFVIKVTHGSTFNIIVKDKFELKRQKIIKQLNTWLNAKFIPCYGEWWYGRERPQIMVEQYLEKKDNGDLLDYKVFCFNGKAKLIDVHFGRFRNHQRNLYDLDWNLLNATIKYPNGGEIERPKMLDKLIVCAEDLSREFAHVRVDFFIVDDHIYFCEYTFANGAGFSPITPYSFDVTMGSWIDLL